MMTGLAGAIFPIIMWDEYYIFVNLFSNISRHVLLVMSMFVYWIIIGLGNERFRISRVAP